MGCLAIAVIVVILLRVVHNRSTRATETPIVVFTVIVLFMRARSGISTAAFNRSALLRLAAFRWVARLMSCICLLISFPLGCNAIRSSSPQALKLVDGLADEWMLECRLWCQSVINLPLNTFLNSNSSQIIVKTYIDKVHEVWIATI